MRIFLLTVACCVLFGLGVQSVGAQQRHGYGERGGDRGNVTVNKYYGGRGGYGGPRYGHYYHQQPSYNPSAVVGGAIGGWLYRQFNPPPQPQVIVVPQQPVRDLAYCYQRYRSFDGSTYLGFDGYRHPCP